MRALPANVFAAEYLAGDLAAARSALVVCNGGASTAYQALAAGVPVVGIPYNLDAYLAMTAIRDAGAGVLVRAGNCSEAAVSGAVRRALSEEPMRRAAREVAVRFERYDARARFRRFVDEVVGIGSTVARHASVAVLAFLLSYSLVRHAAAHPGTGSTPASFEVVDEEKHAVALSSLRGRPVLIVFEDRDGTAQNELLKTRIGLTVKAKGLGKKMSFLPIASVSAFASWPARGFVEKALTDAAKKAGTHVYADWTGDARTKLAAPAGKSTIVLLDGKGRAVWSTSGALDSVAQDRFLEVLVQCVAG